MPIDFHSTIKKISQWAFGSPILNNILSNSLFVAVVVSFIMLFLIMFLYPAKSGTPLSIVFKMFIYMLFSSFVTIFLHDGVVKHIYDEEKNIMANDDLIENSTNPNIVYRPDHKLINPKVGGVENKEQKENDEREESHTQDISDVLNVATFGGRQHKIERPFKNPFI